MQNHRIKQRPATTCEDFDIIRIDTGKYATNTDLIDKCDLYLDRSLYTTDTYQITNRWEDLRYNYGYGIIIKKNREQVIETLKLIDWNKHTVQTARANGLDLRKSDIIAAYNDFLRNEKWHIDYINHYEKHKCKTTE